MHSPITLAEACRRAIDQIQESYSRLQAAREIGGHRATVTTQAGAIEIVIPFTGGDLPYAAVCPCGDDGLELVYLDGAPHRALCPRCTHAERHKDSEGNYLATALDTLLMDTGPAPAPPVAPERPRYSDPEPPEREPEPATLFDDPADSGAIAPWEPDDVTVYRA